MLGDSLKTIVSDYSGAFRYTPNITSVTFGNGIEEINSAFSGQTKLTKVILGKKVKTIGNNAFSGCTSLASFSFPETITNLGTSAFNGAGLRTLTLPSKLTQIPEMAFYNCDSLRSIILGKQITQIANNAFGECDSIREVTVDNTIPEIINIASSFASMRKISFGVSLQKSPTTY